jgi:SAM-dependent methyltransferase
MDGAQPLGRSAEEIEAKLELRARLAVEHMGRVARDGPARECPLCGWRGPFSPVRHKPGIWCPSCDSRPRHRLFKLWLDRTGGFGPHARVLHFAAEPCLSDWIRPAVAEYATADLLPNHDLRLDITAMDLPDGRFDAVIANHVLEHVDDRAALAEIHRVLSPGGVAALTVPLVEGWERTLENPDWTSEAERRAYYTDPQHLRMYGRDFRERLRATGFRVEEFTAEEPDVFRFGLQRGEKIFLARRMEAGAGA